MDGQFSTPYNSNKRRREDSAKYSIGSMPTVVRTPNGMNDAAGQTELIQQYANAERYQQINQKFSKQLFKGTLLTQNGAIRYSQELVQNGKEEPLFNLIPATKMDLEIWKNDTDNRPLIFNQYGKPIFKKQLFSDDAIEADNDLNNTTNGFANIGIGRQLSNGSAASSISNNSTATDEELRSENESSGGKRTRRRGSGFIRRKTFRKKQRPSRKSHTGKGKITLRSRRG